MACTIAGSDSGGGAGVQADLLTFAARGVYGTTVLTCLTAQNPAGVSAVQTLPEAFVRAQFEQVAGYFRLGAVKTGMLLNMEMITAVGELLRARPEIPVVIDPVMVATSGARLLEEEAIAGLRELLPRATVFTPNLDEAAVLLGWRPESPERMREAARELRETCGAAVLLKGGHLAGGEVTDVLANAAGEREFRHARIDGVNTHGSGCTLAAALAAELAKGALLENATERAIGYLRATMEGAVYVGAERFLAH